MARRLTQGEVLNQFEKVHGDRYDYSQVRYINTMTKVKILCPKCGAFWLTPRDHKQGRGCTKCSGYGLSTADILSQFREVHGNRYDYSKVEYKYTNHKVEVICDIHGVFYITPSHHKNGVGCPCCGRLKANASHTKSTESFITEATALHGDRYDYSKVKYINCMKKVEIICPSHGVFWMKPNAHVSGKQNCPKCNVSRGEEEARQILQSFHIPFIQEYSFTDCRNERPLPFDFYLENYHTCIEIDGRQHFEAVSVFGGEEGFQRTRSNDKIKNQYCLQNNITLLRIPYWEFDHIEEILKRELSL